MKKHFLSLSCQILLLYNCISPIPTYASQIWNSFCSNIQTDSLKQNDTQLRATNYVVQTTENQNVQLNSKSLTVNQSSKMLSKDQLQRITNITSTGLLSLFLKYQINDCNKRYYTDTITPILQQIPQNHSLSFVWNNITIKNIKTAYMADQIRLKIQNVTKNKIQLTISFSGLNETSHKRNLNILFPKQGNLTLTTASKNYPLILAAASGNNDDRFYNITLPLTVNTLVLSNNYTNITATGNTTLDKELNIQAANGKITASNMDQLIASSDTTRLKGLKTALILAKFAGQSINKNTLGWNIHWQDNLFKVNGVPIPVW